MLYKVFIALNEDSRKGDFVDLIKKDKMELKIDITNEVIENMSVWLWKKLIKKQS